MDDRDHLRPLGLQPGDALAAPGHWPPMPAPGLLDAIFERSPIGIAVIDFAGRWTQVNPAYCAMYGYGREDLLGQSFLRVFPPERQAEVLALHQRFLREGGHLGGEWRVLRRDGSACDILSESVRLPAASAGEGPGSRLVYVLDITDRKRHQELVVDLAATLPGAMFRFGRGAQGQWAFTYVSGGLDRLLGLTPEELMAEPRALRRRILAEDLAAHDKVIHTAIAAGQGWAHDYRVQHGEGGLRWIHAEASPRRDAQGGLVWSGLLTDVTERKRIEAALAASEETYRTLFETVPQGVVYHAADGRITDANPAALRLLGVSREQLLGLDAFDPRWHAVREDGSPLPGEQHPAARALASGQPVRDMVMGVAVPERGLVWLHVDAIPLFKDGRLTQVYTSFEDITARVQLGQELRRQASTDPLTGLANRRALMERLQIEFDRVQRHPQPGCCVIALDLDHFKAVNDRHGHAAGDAVLRHVAALLREGTRSVDLVARSGGEEFVVLLPDTGAEPARALAERLRAAIEARPVDHDGQAIALTASLGVSPVGRSDLGSDEVLVRADRALYAAKAAGRNRVLVEAAPPSR